jgi:hypothetical protein
MGKRDFTKLIDAPFVASFEYQPTNGHTSLFDDLNQVTSTAELHRYLPQQIFLSMAGQPPTAKW